MTKKLTQIFVLLILILLVNGCAKKYANSVPAFPAPTEAVLDAVDASGSVELQTWVYKDLQALWDKLDARQN